MKYILALLFIPIGFAIAPSYSLIGVVLAIVGLSVLIIGLANGDLPLFGSKR